MKSISLLFSFLVTIAASTMGQSPWPKVYFDQASSPSYGIIETYDHGYILMGQTNQNAASYNYLLKTDVNGEVLWEKRIGASNVPNTMVSIKENNNGEIFIGGINASEDLYGDPWVAKLSPCGELLWCSNVHSPGIYDYANAVIPTPDGGCIVSLVLNTYDPELQTDRVCLMGIDNQGNKQWRQCYNPNPDTVRNEIVNHVLDTGDGILLSGICDQHKPGSNWWYLKGYYVKTDYEGNEAWTQIIMRDLFEKEYSINANTSSISQDNNWVISSIQHYLPQNLVTPAFLIMSPDGSLQSIHDMTSGYEQGGMVGEQFVNDTTLIAGIGYGSSLDELNSYAVKYDTNGNNISQRLISDEHFSPLTVKTFDGKYLFFTNSFKQGHWDAWLHKLNENLEDDSLYTQPIEYDYLCDNLPIVHDTIPVDQCQLIVGKEEVALPPKTRLHVWPNPARGLVQVEVPTEISWKEQAGDFQINHTRYQYEATLEVRNAFGQLQSSQKISQDQQLLELNTTYWPAGLYALRLVYGKRTVGTAKLMVQ